MSQNPVFTTFAPSVPAGSHEMRDHFSNFDPPRTSPYTAPTITPYLGLRSRLSQVWFNRWTILLSLVLARILIASSSASNALTSSKGQALSACSTVEAMGSVMASMPYYMSQGVNELTASGVEKSVNALMDSSTLAVTATEEIVVFVINMMYSTYFCLISFAVNGSLHTALGALDDAQTALNGLTNSIGNDMATSLTDFENTYNGILSKLNGVVTGLGSGVHFPTFPDVNDTISKLQDLTIPSSVSDGIQKLNSTLPDFTNVQNLTDNVIRLPFEQIKGLIDTYQKNYTFNRSVFPVPQKEQLSFCSDDNGISDFFDHLHRLVATAKKVFVAVLALAAVLACIPMAYREIRRWRIARGRSVLVGSQERDPMDVFYIGSRPYTSTAGIKVSQNIKSDRRQILVRWIIAYITSDAALFVLALAVAGLFSCLCHYILLRSIQGEVPALTNKVANFTDEVVNKLTNASEQWALGANQAIADTNNSINQNMFGWVNTSTTALNDTLNTFVDLTTQTLNETFGGTVLYQPILDVLNCLVLLKVAGIQKGLDFVHDNAHINLPLLPNDTFSLGAAASVASGAPADQSFLANPGDVAADKISSVIDTIIIDIEQQVRTEAIISACLLGVYLIAVLSAVVRAAMLWRGQDKVRGEGGAAPHMTESQPAAFDFRSDNQDQFVQFDNIPLGPVHHEQGPAPRYSTAIEEKAAQEAANNPFADPRHVRVQSEYGTDNKT